MEQSENVEKPNCTVVQIGARRYYMVPRVFHDNGCLHGLYTDFFIQSRTAVRVLRIMRYIGFKKIGSVIVRHNKHLVNAPIKDYKRFGWLLSQSLKRVSPSERRTIKWREAKKFASKIQADNGLKANIIYSFPEEAHAVFKSVGDFSFKCLDQNSLGKKNEENILKEEVEKWPDWNTGACRPDRPFDEYRDEREERELADIVLCPSEYSAQVMHREGLPQSKIKIVPYPTDLDLFESSVRLEHDGPLRVLFLGRLNLAKGAPYLLEAAERLGNEVVKVRVVGEIDVPVGVAERYRDVVEMTGIIPRNEVCRELRHADLLCHPSLLEGQSLATNEALAAGLPVVATPNAGSRVRNGIDGTIIAARNPDEIVRILKYYAENRDYLIWQSGNAVRDRGRLSYSTYRDHLIKVCGDAYDDWLRSRTSQSEDNLSVFR